MCAIKVVAILTCPDFYNWDELHKASVTERFIALGYATVRYQKKRFEALRNCVWS